MKAGKSTEFNLKLEVPIWSNFLLAMSGAGEEEEGRLALASWLAGQSESQLIQTRLD